MVSGLNDPRGCTSKKLFLQAYIKTSSPMPEESNINLVLFFIILLIKIRM
jgi:hypothetical protein